MIAVHESLVSVRDSVSVLANAGLPLNVTNGDRGLTGTARTFSAVNLAEPTCYQVTCREQSYPV